jgi:hypothetical protein
VKAKVAQLLLSLLTVALAFIGGILAIQWLPHWLV